MSGDPIDLDAITRRAAYLFPTYARRVLDEDVPALVAEVRSLRDRDAETRRLIEAWVRHGRAVPAEVTTYDRELVNMELLAIVERP